MSSSVMDSIIKYISKQPELERLALTWFGGEPLMAQKEMREFYRKLRTIFTGTIESNIITTGYHICPETMGKVNQLGTLHEVLELCKIDERIIPCIDFGHLNARDLGIIRGKDDFESIILEIKNQLGEYRFKNFHSHFSKIEYTTGGEKRHLTFEDTVYGPDFEPLMELVYKYGLSPTFVCESAGTQAEDAKAMKDYYLSLF